MGRIKNRGHLLTAAKSGGYTGKAEDGLASLKSWLDDGNRIIKDSDGAVDLEVVWEKMVVIQFDSTEDEVVLEDTAEGELEGDEDEIEEKAEGDEEDEDEEKSASKSFRAGQKSAMKNARRTGTAARHPTAGRIGDKISVQKKAYDSAVKHQRPMRGSKGALPVYSDADQAEWAGAAQRLTALGATPYPQKAADTAICQKAGSTFNPATGGVLVAGDYLPELIELFDQYGVARRAVGVTAMRESTLDIPRLDSDVTVYDVGENAVITESDAGTSLVTLTATKTAALSRQPSELLNDAAINVGDIISRSSARAVAKWEDEAYFTGSHNRTGLTDLQGTIGTDQFDSVSGGWSGITISDIQSTIGLLPGWAHSEGIALSCSAAFYSTVLDTFAMSAGGNTGSNLKAGFAGMTMWGQYPVFINEVMPSAYVDGQSVLQVGAFGAASKFGVVTGSEQLVTSDQRYFDQDQVAFRYTQRWAISCHDVGGSGSGVVALLA